RRHTRFSRDWSSDVCSSDLSFQYDHINDKNPKTNKTGIRCHHFIIALILRFFGKIHIEKTKEGKSVYLNRKSFKKWIKWRGFSRSEERRVGKEGKCRRMSNA